MSVKAIQPSLDAKRNKNNAQNNVNKNQPSFKGMGNPVVTVMDAIDRGGFAASFIAQDGIGMVAPRIKEGLNRNRKKDENGNLTGPLNWEFARREGVREILSGPSAFIIPAGIIAVIKKQSGTANNVHIDHIQAFGKTFANYAENNAGKLANTDQAKKEIYEIIMKNTLEASTHGELKGEALEKLSKEFAQDLINIENAKSKGFLKNLVGTKVENSSQDLTTDIVDRFMKLRKQYLAPSNNELAAKMSISGTDKHLDTNFKKLISSMPDYFNDALKSTHNYLEKNKNANAKEFVEKFNLRRIGTRAMSNVGMFLTVVGFYTIIPKLYNLGIKKDPGLAGLEEDTVMPQENQVDKEEKNKENQKDVSFKGGMQSVAIGTGKKVTESSFLQKALQKFEFNGPSMSVPAMLTLLFGFCFPPRLVNAKSDKEKKEIVVRDLSSFVAILFGAKALARGFSDMFAKLSGLALNTKPDSHKNSLWNKVMNYITPSTGVDVLNSEQIVSKYSNIHQYKDGINGFFEFLENSGGNVKKMLKMDKVVKENAEKIIGKSLNEVDGEAIKEAFKNIKDNDALQKIYKQFELDAKGSNKFIKRAKTMNSTFGFASTLILVPAFMIWLARYCENMTKKAVAAEKAQNNGSINKTTTPEKNIQTPELIQPHIASSKPSMEGFLKQ